jgi:benzodiazapine receptor
MGNTVKLVVSVAVPLLVGGLSGFATARGVESWYPTLIKPSFTPPSWVFGPVWTLLYLMMGVAAFLVWQQGLNAPGVKSALIAFLTQLFLNGLWSILFFGLRMPGLALLEMIVLWVSIGVTVVLFWRVSAIAGMLLLPYEAWVSFAAVLNGSLWYLNR